MQKSLRIEVYNEPYMVETTLYVFRDDRLVKRISQSEIKRGSGRNLFDEIVELAKVREATVMYQTAPVK